MRRMIDPLRLAALLRPSGFALSLDSGESLIWYARPGDRPELWEQIAIVCGGHRGQSVGARVFAKVCGCPIGALGLSEDRFVAETGRPERPPPEPPTGGSMPLHTPEDAVNWERRVAAVVPEKASEFANEVGPALLARTADARAAVDRYLERFGTRDWRQLRAKLEPRATSGEFRRAEQIAATPPTIQVFNGHEFYKTIVLGIILHSDDVEGRQIAPADVKVWPPHDPFSKKEPDWSDWALAWRIEILADRMLCRYPEPMPSRISDDDSRIG